MKKRGKGRSRELEEVGEERRLPDSDRSRRRLFSFARDRWRLASLLSPLEHRPRPTKVLPSHRRDEEQSSSVHRARESGARTAVPRPRSVSFFLSRAAAPSSSATAEKRRCRAQKKKEALSEKQWAAAGGWRRWERGSLSLSRVSLFFCFCCHHQKLSIAPPRTQAPPRATLPSPRRELAHALNDPTTKDSHVVVLLVCSRGVRKGEGGKRKLLESEL